MPVDGLVSTRQGVFGLIILVLVRGVPSLTAVRQGAVKRRKRPRTRFSPRVGKTMNGAIVRKTSLPTFPLSKKFQVLGLERGK